MPEPLPTRIGRYEIIDRLRGGGMGVVYLARDPLLGRTLAIKVLTSVDNDELRERFALEARRLAALQHPHIVTIFDVGEDHDRPFIAMEFVDGETMGELINRRANVHITRKLTLTLQLCDGLGYAHRNGIIHRDIKPANLMITAEGGALKILDFGLARMAAQATQAGLTRAGAILGTPHYMSPEQIEGIAVDHRSDVFAVGLVLYELLTYQRAYPGDVAHAVLHKIVHTAPRAVRELYPEIDAELEAVVNKGIEKVLENRYQNLSALATDLRCILDRLDTNDEATVRIGPSGASQQRDHGSGSGRHETPSSAARQIPNLDEIARRRSAQIDEHLDEARRHFDSGNYDGAIERCEQAAVLDPNDAHVLDLLQRAHAAIEERQLRAWLAEAEARLTRGELTAAEHLIEQSLQRRPESTAAQLLQRRARKIRRDYELSLERAQAVKSAIARARANLQNGALEAALRCSTEALAHDPQSDEARLLREEVLAALQDREQYEAEGEGRGGQGGGQGEGQEAGGRSHKDPREETHDHPLRPSRVIPQTDSRDRNKRPWAAIAAAVILVVGAVVGWQLFGHRSVEPTVDEAKSTRDSVAQLVKDGRPDEALPILERALQRWPMDSQLIAVANQLIGDAKQKAAAARARADQAHAGEEAPFRDAARAAEQADTEASQGHISGSIRSYWRAADLFDKALKSAGPVKEVEALIASGEREKALDALVSGLKETPNHSGLVSLLGRLRDEADVLASGADSVLKQRKDFDPSAPSYRNTRRRHDAARSGTATAQKVRELWSIDSSYRSAGADMDGATSLFERGLRAIQSTNRAEAQSALADAQRRYPGFKATRDLLDRVRSWAKDEAERARRTAVSAGATKDLASFARATQRESAAGTTNAVEAWWEAVDLYEHAAEEARRSKSGQPGSGNPPPTNPGGSGTPGGIGALNPPTSTPGGTSSPTGGGTTGPGRGTPGGTPGTDDKGPVTDPPKPTVTSGAGEVTPPKPALDRPGVDAALRLFVDAYQRLDVKAMSKVLPDPKSDLFKRLEREKKYSCSGYVIQFDSKPRFEMLGETAQVIAKNIYICKSVAGKNPPPATYTDSFLLRRDASGHWIIVFYGRQDA